MGNVLKYEKKIASNPKDLFKTLMQEQLKYFQFYDSKIKQLTEGIKISKPFYTKTTKEKVNGVIEITKIKENEEFQMKTSYSKGEILQTFHIFEEEGAIKICYMEGNSFEKKRDRANFSLVSLPYRILFRMQLKKRIKYLEQQTLQREGIC